MSLLYYYTERLPCVKFLYQQSFSKSILRKLRVKTIYLRIAIFIVNLLILSMVAHDVRASDVFPNKSLTVIVGFSPGSGTDTVIRIMQPALSRSLGVPVIVINRPGAGGAVGTQALVDSPGDGYTIGFSLGATFVTNHFFKKQSYDPMTDFTYLTRIGYLPRMLLVNKDFPARTHQDFLSELEKNPAKYFYATILNSLDMLNAEIYKATTGVNIVSIPYGDNAGSSLRADLLSNRVQIFFDSTAAAMPIINAGHLFPIAITGTTRSGLFPNTPTFLELGIKDLRTASWYGFVGPADIPIAHQQILIKALHSALNDDFVKEKLIALGISIAPSSPQEHRADVINMTKLYSAYVQKLNIKPKQ